MNPSGQIGGSFSRVRVEAMQHCIHPRASSCLVNPANATITEAALRDVEPAARAMGCKILNVDTSTEINAAFATFVRKRPDALFVAPGAFFTDRRVQLVQLAARHAVPAIYPDRRIAEVGGLK